MSANDEQIGGNHYKKGGEEHWDRAWRLNYDCFQYIITKWIERWKEKGGLQDLKKAQHAIAKYIEVVEALEATELSRTTSQDVLEQPERSRMDNFKPTSEFTWEVGTVDWDLWTCKACKTEVKTGVGRAPGRDHNCNNPPGYAPAEYQGATRAPTGAIYPKRS